MFGGSWGSTLALLYAQTYPLSCRGLVLRGVFLARQTEIDWFLYGVAKVFPEATLKMMKQMNFPNSLVPRLE